MTRICPVERCSATLAADEEICRGSARRLAGQLRAIPELLEELDVTLARIGSSEPTGIRGALTGGCKPGCDHAADNPSCIAGVVLDVNLAASEATAQLRTVLHGWARVWDEETPLGVVRQVVRGPLNVAAEEQRVQAEALKQRRARDRAMSKASTQALLLAAQPLGARPWAGDIANEIAAAIHKAEAAIDIPPDVRMVGPCRNCGMGLTAAIGAVVATCRWCGTTLDVEASREALLGAADDTFAPAATIERALGPDVVTAAMIRGWRHRGSLDAAGVNERGQPLYRISDVARLARFGAESSAHPT